MQIRDGPAAVRGDALPPHATGPRAREGGGGGSPESEDLPPAAISNPSRKEDSLLRRSLIVASLRSRSRRRCVPHRHAAAFPVTVTPPTARSPPSSRRIVSLSPTATEDLFAVGAGTQVVAVDDQSDYPAAGAADEALGLHARTRRRSRVQPRPRRRLVRRRARRARSRSSGSPCCSSRRRDTLGRRTSRSGSSARRPATPRRRRAVVAAMQEQIAKLIRSGAEAPRHLRVYHELDARLLLGDVDDLHRPGLQAVRLHEHRRRGGHDALRLPAALGASTSSREPELDRARGHGVLRADGASVAARPGWSHVAAVKQHGASIPSTTRRLALGAAPRRLRRGGRQRGRGAPG